MSQIKGHQLASDLVNITIVGHLKCHNIPNSQCPRRLHPQSPPLLLLHSEPTFALIVMPTQTLHSLVEKFSECVLQVKVRKASEFPTVPVQVQQNVPIRQRQPPQVLKHCFGLPGLASRAPAPVDVLA